MSMVSKYPLEKDIKDRVYEIFLKTLADLKTPKEIGEFLEEFLTPTEKIMLAKRLSIAILLSKNFEFRTISKILKVSLPTISDVNLWIKHHKGGMNKVVESILKDEKTEEFWNKVDYAIARISIPLSTGNWSDKRRKLEKEKFKSIKPF